ncbi:hypothetical protein TRIUR3_02906 [Triticum urartu]|uniref:Uncharacterized protein n=1 Tax=Triticum urartu TaxID=4572 RepID=M7YQP1_TRIUA|nr:hypothetical protein TRIUR3_02906 [Triticum urartu]
MADLLAVERKLNDTGSAVKTNGSLLLQAFATVELLNIWFNGAFSKVAEAGHVAGSRTNRKVPDSCVKYISQNSRASPDP